MEKLVTVASIVTYVCLALLVAAFSLNAWGVVSGDFEYHCDAQFFALIQLVLGASTAVWTAGGIASYRQRKAEEVFEAERLPTVPPGKLLVKKAEQPRYEEAIECVIISESKAEQDHLSVLFPKPVEPWDGELALPSKEIEQ